MFTVLTGRGGEDWLDAARQIGNEFGIRIEAVSIAHATDTFDAYGQWAAQREIEDDGCVLVRPDRFVAWRSTTRAADPAMELRRVLAQVLGTAPRAPSGAQVHASGVAA